MFISADMLLQSPALPTVSPKLSSLILLCIALLSVSFAPIFIRFSETELGSFATVFNRFVVFCIAFGGTQILIRQFSLKSSPVSLSEVEPAHSWLLLVATGVVATLSLALWAIALEYTTVAKCMLLNNLTPIFTSLGSWLVFRKLFDLRFVSGLIIALGGAMSLGLADFFGNNEGHLLGDCYALLSAVFLGIYFLLVEFLRTRYSATTILLWRCSVGCVLLVPIVYFAEGQFFPTTIPAICAVLGLGIVSEGLGQRLLAQSLNQFSSSFIALFLLLEPIVSALLAWGIFQEALNPTTLLGFVVILSGLDLAQSSNSAQQDLATETVPVQN
jgi:drug/metabolite transporter (DMT)-like permease